MTCCGPSKGFYCGRRLSDGTVQVCFDGIVLNPRTDLRNHSPTGFEWGYGGSGPAQLALAICAHALQNDQLALKHYQEFKEKLVANFPKDHFKISRAVVVSFINDTH